VIINDVSSFYKVVQQHNLGDTVIGLWQVQVYVYAQIIGINNSERIIKIEPRLTKLCYTQKSTVFRLTVYFHYLHKYKSRVV